METCGIGPGCYAGPTPAMGASFGELNFAFWRVDADTHSRDSFQRFLIGERPHSLDSLGPSVSTEGSSRHPRGQTDSPGVGAVFYTQVALEVIPDDGSRDRLRASVHRVFCPSG